MPRMSSSRLCLSLLTLAAAGLAHAQTPFLSAPAWSALRDTASGALPYDNLRVLTGLHRVPATPAFDTAAEFMLRKAVEYGLQEAHIERFAADGSTQYGLMRAYWGWQVDAARLSQTGAAPALLADWSTNPIRLADYSHSADVDSELIDVGDGTKESDYANKNVRGKIILADGVLSEVQSLAIMKKGAAGILSDMPNQSTAWSGLDATLIRWGHLDARLTRGFAFMISKAEATALRAQMSTGKPVTLSAHVKAEVVPGQWSVVSAVIPGTDPRAGEIVFSCHLDHERPGANDNGSGCVTILESARILATAIAAGQLPRPLRTLRFVWGPEIEGTMAFLAKHPQIRQSLRANVHMDMVGGDPFKNKSILHVTETPWSLPSFITDVGAAFAENIRAAATAYANDGQHAQEAVVEDRNGATGTRNVFLVDRTPYDEGSDHDVYDSSTVAVPSLYLRDWPDIYIHTDHDSLDKIDATKLRRVALLGAASGYTYAALQPAQVPALMPYFAVRAQQRLASAFDRAQGLLRDDTSSMADAVYEARNLMAHALRREAATLNSVPSFAGASLDTAKAAVESLNTQSATFEKWLDEQAAQRGIKAASGAPAWQANPAARRVPHRTADFGPLNYQNDDVLLHRLGAERVAKIALLSGDANRMLNTHGQGAIYAYEIVNFINGQRTVGEICDAVSAEFGPLPLEAVVDFLKACEEAKLVAF